MKIMEADVNYFSEVILNFGFQSEEMIIIVYPLVKERVERSDNFAS